MENPKQLKHDFDLDFIANTLKTKNIMIIKLYRQDRKLTDVILEISQKSCICARSANKKIIYSNQQFKEMTFKDDLDLFLSKLQVQINQARECVFCNSEFLNNTDITKDRKMCFDCETFCCVSTRETCIVCTQSVHPTSFKCETCIDSNVCLKCFKNPLWKNECPTCKKKVSVFGRKRVLEYDYDRCYHFNSDDEDDL